MSDGVQHIQRAVAIVSLAASNAGAWVSDFNVGAVTTGLTVLGLGGIGLMSRYITETSKAKLQAWAEQQRTEMQIRAEREKLEASSLQAQISKLQASIEENRERTEDANKKLHDIRDQAHADGLRHAVEVDRLTDQLKETNEELRSSRQEIRALRDEERRLLALVALRQEKQDVQITRNAQAIESVATQTGSEIPPPTPPSNATPH